MRDPCNRLPINPPVLVSLFVTTLGPTVRVAESLTHCSPTTYRDPLCANSYSLRSSRGALAPGANSKVPASYQQTPRGHASRRVAFSRGFASSCGDSCSLPRLSRFPPKRLIPYLFRAGARDFGFELSLSRVTTPRGVTRRASIGALERLEPGTHGLTANIVARRSIRDFPELEDGHQPC